MLGGIVGDYVGSVYEAYQWKSKELELFSNTPVSENPEIRPLFENTKWVRNNNNWTDDTLCTLGLYKAFLNNTDPTKTLIEVCTKYEDPNTGFGKSFGKWLLDPKPYNSYANGSIMRLGFLPFMPISLSEKLKKSFEYTEITHNHQESFEAVTHYIILMQNLIEYPLSERKDVIMSYLLEHGNVKTLNDYHNEFKFELHANKTLHQAVTAVYFSDSFVSTLKNCFYIGGDCDTMACVAGNIASLLYPIPDSLLKLVLENLKQNEELYGLALHFKQNYSKNLL